MQHIQNAAQVREWMRQKQELEVRLAWDLLETFNTTPDLINPIRNMARLALDEMKALKSRSPAGSAAVTQAWQAELACGICKKYPAGVNSIPSYALDAQECSDVIRIYGTFIERAGGLNVHIGAGDYQDYAVQSQQKDDLRQGGAQVWNKDMMTQFAGRHRWEADSKIGRQTVQQAPLLGQSGQGGPWQVHSFLKSQDGGIKRFILADTSTLNKIDRVYGLVPAADISGTTTDTIYFITRFGGGLDPVFQLLPLATIVAGAHHSLLEVALSLSLNDIVDYDIGFYGSLMPQGAVVGAGEISSALAAAERSFMNRHLLVYYSMPGMVGGCFVFEGRDLWGFRNFSKGRLILGYFASMPPWPLEYDIRDFCEIHRVRLN